jgi:hypothetical protein
MAESSVRVAALDRLPDRYPLAEPSPRQHERSCRMAMMRFAEAVRTDLDHAIGLGDTRTADVLREISRKVGEVMILPLGALLVPRPRQAARRTRLSSHAASLKTNPRTFLNRIGDTP